MLLDRVETNNKSELIKKEISPRIKLNTTIYIPVVDLAADRVSLLQVHILLFHNTFISNFL